MDAQRRTCVGTMDERQNNGLNGRVDGCRRGVGGAVQCGASGESKVIVLDAQRAPPLTNQRTRGIKIQKRQHAKCVLLGWDQTFAKQHVRTPRETMHG